MTEGGDLVAPGEAGGGSDTPHSKPSPKPYRKGGSMKLWSVPFRVGHYELAVHCKGCDREWMVRTATIMLLWYFKTEVTYCPYCGSLAIVTEDASKEARDGEGRR